MHTFNFIVVMGNRLRSIIFLIAVGSCAQSLPTISFSPGVISTIAGSGFSQYSGDNGPALSAGFRDPSGLAIGSGYLYIADTTNNVIRRVAMNGYKVTTVAGTGTPGYAGDGGYATSAALHSPLSVVIDASGNLFIADTGNDVVRRVDAEGQITTVAGRVDTLGKKSTDGVGDGEAATAATLWHPSSLAIDSGGNLYIADTYHNRIRRLDATTHIITTIAGNGIAGYSGDGGDASRASLNLPSSIAVNSDGIAITDANNVVRWVDNATHHIVTIAGGGNNPGNDTLGDGQLSTGAFLLNPMGLAFNATGRMLYVSDSLHSLIRQIDTKTRQITVVAGIDPSRRALLVGRSLSSLTNSPLDTSLDVPVGIVSADDGTLYFVDSGNDVVRRLSFSTGSLVIHSGLGINPKQTILINNTGGPASALSLTLVGNSDFALSSNNCPVQLPSGGTCQATVSFSPRSGENASSTLFVFDEEANYPIAISSVAIAGQPAAAEYDSDTCVYTLGNPSSQLLYPEESDKQSVSVTTGAACSWTADSDSPWLVVSGGASSTGDGKVTYFVEPNLSWSDRVGTMYIAGQSMSVIQLGKSASLSPPPSSSSNTLCEAAKTQSANGPKTNKQSVHNFLMAGKVCQE